jgi:hypothetical protein
MTRAAEVLERRTVQRKNRRLAIVLALATVLYMGFIIVFIVVY